MYNLLTDFIKPLRWLIPLALAIGLGSDHIKLPGGQLVLFSTLYLTSHQLAGFFYAVTVVQCLTLLHKVTFLNLGKHLSGFYKCNLNYDFRSISSAKQNVRHPQGWSVVEPASENDAAYATKLLAVLARWDQGCGKCQQGQKQDSFYTDLRTLQTDFQFTLRLKRYPGWQHYGVEILGAIEDVQGSNRLLCLVEARESFGFNRVKLRGLPDLFRVCHTGLPVVVKFKQYFTTLAEAAQKEAFYLHLRIYFDLYTRRFVLSPATAYLELEPNDMSTLLFAGCIQAFDKV